jgi:hypothetical protein
MSEVSATCLLPPPVAVGVYADCARLHSRFLRSWRRLLARSGTIHLQLRVVLGGAEFSDTGGARVDRGTPSLPYVPFLLHLHVVIDDLAPSDMRGTAFARGIARSF